MKDLALRVSGVIFLFLAAMHLLRVFFKVQVIVGNFTVPLAASIFGFLVALLLSLWMFSAVKK